MSTPEQFQRLDGRVDVTHLQNCRVAVVGVGAVGSRVADELARCGVGELVLIDGDTLDTYNIVRHVLGAGYVGRNKAEALADYISQSIGGIRIEFVAEAIGNQTPDLALDTVLAGADLIVAATDDRRTQRRINRRALDLDIPSIYPGIDATADRGEVFVSLGRGLSPCFECWDLFRSEQAALREVAALNLDIYATVEATARLCLGLLDPDSEFATPLYGNRESRRPRTIFLVSRFGARPRGVFADGRTNRRGVPDFRIDCPACGGRPERSGQASRRPARRAGAFRPPQPRPQTDTETVTRLSRNLLVGITLLFLLIAAADPAPLTWALLASALLALTVEAAVAHRLRGTTTHRQPTVDGPPRRQT